MENKIDVKMGEFAVAKEEIIMQTIGLGSCIAICLYDRKNNIGGLAHIMSSKSEMDEEVRPGRFADKAIKMMLDEMIDKGADSKFITAKIAGGASMFPKVTEFLNVGNENIIAVRKELKKNRIRITGEDVGGNQGRSVWLDVGNGDVIVSHVKGETKQI